MQMLWSSMLVLVLVLTALHANVLLAKEVVIPSDCFDSQSKFDAIFKYHYPWGTDHNGGARMNESQVKMTDGTLTLTATKVTGLPPAKHGGNTIPINYLAGAVHAKQHFTVEKGGGLDFTGEFKATTTKGTWPAFWLTAVVGWPPEIDMAEWKGSGKISFNTFNTSSKVSAKDVPYPDPDKFHKIKCELRDANGVDMEVKFFMDGKLVTTQVGKEYVGKAFWLIINLQMEGSSGKPGPTSDTPYSVRKLEVISYNKKTAASSPESSAPAPSPTASSAAPAPSSAAPAPSSAAPAPPTTAPAPKALPATEAPAPGVVQPGSSCRRQ